MNGTLNKNNFSPIKKKQAYKKTLISFLFADPAGHA